MAKLKNRRWERFAREYIANGFNGAKAARAVGCSVDSSPSMAGKWLGNEHILQRVNDLNDDINDDTIMSAKELLQEASAMAKANIKDCYDEDGRLLHPIDMTDETASGIHEVQQLGAVVTSIKFGKDKGKAMDMLAKHHNMYEGHQQAGAAVFFMDDKDAAT